MKKNIIEFLKKQFHTDILIVFTIVAITNIFGFYSRFFFRDFSIIFEGAYRINLGQIPYKDFFIPVGPVVFYIQAIYNLFFGSTAFSMAIHAAINTSLIALLYFKLASKSFTKPMSYYLSFMILFSYNGLSNYPWYNLTAYLFFWIIMYLLINKASLRALSPYELITISTVTMLAFYSKQDMLLVFPLVCLHLLFSYRSRSNYLNIFVFYIIPTIFLILLPIIYFQANGDFFYWFNFGQFPHQSRLASILNIKSFYSLISKWQFFVLLLSVFLTVTTKKSEENKSYYRLIIIILFCNLILSFTSGHGAQSLLQGIPWIVLLFYRIFGDNHNKKKERIAVVLIILFTLLTLNPVVRLSGYVLRNISTIKLQNNNKMFEKTCRKLKIANLSRIKDSSYSGVILKNTHNQNLNALKAYIRKRGKRVINFSEFSFIYTDLNIDPPKGLPLWFDHGISFFDENINFILEQTTTFKHAIVLLQDPHDHSDMNVNRKFHEGLIKRGFSVIRSLEAPSIRSNIVIYEK